MRAGRCTAFCQHVFNNIPIQHESAVKVFIQVSGFMSILLFLYIYRHERPLTEQAQDLKHKIREREAHRS